MAQTSDVMEIKGSRVKMLGILTAGVVMTTAAAAVVFHWLPAAGRHGASEPSVAWSWLALVFFAYGTAVAGWRLLNVTQTVLTIRPYGIKDIRFATDPVPWTAVRSITTRQVSWQKFIVLAIDPSVERRLALTRAAKWWRGPNRMFGVDGLCVSAIGLRISHDALLKACLEHWRTAGGESAREAAANSR